MICCKCYKHINNQYIKCLVCKSLICRECINNYKLFYFDEVLLLYKLNCFNCKLIHI